MNKGLPISLLLTICLTTVFGQQFDKKNLNVAAFKSQNMETASKKIFIKNFKIYYQMIAEAESTVQGGRQLGGGTYKGDATARLAVGVEGISPEDLQELTNGLYDQYTSDLESQGFEIFTADNIPDIESFDGWEKVSGPTINEEQIKGSLMVIPDGFSYFIKGVTRKGKEKTGAFMSGVTGDDGSFASVAYGPVPKISEELGDMIVAEIVFNVPSIYLDPKSRLGTAKVKGGAYLRLQNAKTSYIYGRLNKPGVASPDASVELLLTAPVQINGVFESQEFKAIAERSTTTVPSYASFFTVEDKTVELTNTIECDPEDYKREVAKPIEEYLKLSLQKVKSAMSGEKVR